MGAFAKSVLQNTKQVQQELNDNIIQFAQEAFVSVVEKSPSKLIGSNYAEGELKNQWYPAANALSSSLTSAKSQVGADSLSRISSMDSWKTFLGKDGYVSLTNNISYAYQAEALGWGYTTPYGMVERAYIEAKAKLK